MDQVRARLAQALGWTEAQAGSLSLASLRELVRPISPALAAEATDAIRSGRVVVDNGRAAPHTEAMASARPRFDLANLPPPWLALAQHAGGVLKLAEELAVNRRTLNGWITGYRKPTRLAREAVNRWARARHLEPPFLEEP